MQNLGNYPCSCGSGKKYIKCCVLKNKKSEIPSEVINQLSRMKFEEDKLRSMGIYINYVKPLIHDGKKFWALGGRLYFNRRPEETFHEFIVEILKDTLGREWWHGEFGAQQKHFIILCYLHYLEWSKKNATEENRVDDNTWMGFPDGWSQSLISLAFDVATLQHTNNLPEKILDRLKHKDQYQGARYEVAIAAIFARLDCEIDFLDDREDVTQKHCEFFAKHRPSGIVIAVEAKSRHRPGVIHTVGVEDDRKNMKGDVQGLINRALKQNPGDKPFMIFIDVNSPPTPDIKPYERQWSKDIEKVMKRKGECTQENPDPWNGIFFTNFSSHYEKIKEASGGESFSVMSFFPKFPLPDWDFLRMLNDAMAHYGQVPNIEPKREI